MTEVLRGVLGLAVLILIGIALSENRRAIKSRVVLSALGCKSPMLASLLDQFEKDAEKG